MLKENKKTWYASPLKALSNDKYRDFRKIFSPELVGILTGDRKENPKAPVIVGTTEIFRNILIEEGINNEVDVDFFVIDEAHWIKDPERGVSWEEAIIFAPRKTQLLLLSATFPNIEEIALWISEVREKEVKVVYKLKRPVPLVWYSIGRKAKPLFLGNVSDELVRINFDEINKDETKFSLFRAVNELKEIGAFPAIFFVNSRKETEEYAFSVGKFLDSDGEEEREKFCEQYYELFPYIKGDKFVINFIKKGVAPHHAGLLPALKILFEDSLKEGLARIIFATKTLASGIDVPAKSVVITDQFTYDGKGMRPLLPSELFQMAGRAGRRGKDEIGYVFIASPITEKTKELFRELEPIRSSFYINPHLVLNLLKKFDVPECLEVIRKSLKFFEIKSRFEKWEKKLREEKEKINELNEKFLKIKPQEFNCSTQTNITFRNTLENIRYDKEREKKLIKRINLLEKIYRSLGAGIRRYPQDRIPQDEKKYIAFDEKGRIGIVESEGDVFVFSTNEGKRMSKRWKFSVICEIDEEELQTALETISLLPRKYKEKTFLLVDIKRIISNSRKSIERIKVKNANREKEMEKFPCQKCPVFQNCTEISQKVAESTERIEKLARNNPDSVEKEFRANLELLKELGYIDDKYFLTEKGWEASKLKNPRSIYIFEALEKGFFGNTPEDFAATTALVLSEPKPPFVKPPKGIEGLFAKIYYREVKLEIQPKITPVKIWGKNRFAFLDGKVYKATYMWAKGAELDEVEEETEIEPGDFSRIVIQTVEVLRQIENIYGYKEIAQEAIKKIYRSPISDFVE